MNEQSISERGSRKYNGLTRNQISRGYNLGEKKIIDQQRKERKQMQIATQGNGKYIMDGSNDRVNGKKYDGFNPKYNQTEEDKTSYYYGYTVHGNKRLEAIIYMLEKEGKYDEIAAIGKRDYELDITEVEIGLIDGQEPIGLAKYQSYMEGYNAAKTSSKSRR